MERRNVYEPCQKCGRKTQKTCQRCHKVKYCSKECQSEDWTKHKEQCNLPDRQNMSLKEKIEALRTEIAETANKTAEEKKDILSKAEVYQEQMKLCLDTAKTLDTFCGVVFKPGSSLGIAIYALLSGCRDRPYPLMCIVDMEAKTFRMEMMLPGTIWYHKSHFTRQLYTYNEGCVYNVYHVPFTVSSLMIKGEKVEAPCDVELSVSLRYSFESITPGVIETLSKASDEEHAIVFQQYGTWTQERPLLKRYPFPKTLKMSLDELVAGIFATEQLLECTRILSMFALRGNGLVYVTIHEDNGLWFVAHYLGSSTNAFKFYVNHYVERASIRGILIRKLNSYSITLQLESSLVQHLIDWRPIGRMSYADEIHTRFGTELRTGKCGIFLCSDGRRGVTRTISGVQKVDPIYTF